MAQHDPTHPVAFIPEPDPPIVGQAAAPAPPGWRAALHPPRAVAGAVVAAALIGGVISGTVSQGLIARGTAAQVIPAPAPLASLNPASALQTSLASVAQKVGPAVVSIRTDQGLGSGVLYDPSGLILTNAHVVNGASSITVGLADGRHFPGAITGADAGFDLAVIKIDGQSLPTAHLGSSSTLQVGELAVAIGNPYGLDNTVTMGVVSALDRPVSEGQGSYNQPMIQTDTAINPGNSGGPLVDLQGNVVGITTLIAAPRGVPAQGLGFAVPVDTARRIAPQLVRDGRVSHSGQPYLGMSLGDLNDRAGLTPSQPGFRSGQRAPRPSRPVPSSASHGALVGQVLEGGPAAQAGLKGGDIVTAFDGAEIYNPDELLRRLVLHAPGDRVPLTIMRDGQPQDLSIVLGEAPAQQA